MQASNNQAVFIGLFIGVVLMSAQSIGFEINHQVAMVFSVLGLFAVVLQIVWYACRNWGYPDLNDIRLKFWAERLAARYSFLDKVVLYKPKEWPDIIKYVVSFRFSALTRYGTRESRLFTETVEILPDYADDWAFREVYEIPKSDSAYTSEWDIITYKPKVGSVKRGSSSVLYSKNFLERSYRYLFLLINIIKTKRLYHK